MKLYLPVLDMVVPGPIKDVGLIVEDVSIPEPSPNPIGWIIAIVVGAIVVVGLTICFIKKNKKNKSQENEE